MKTIALAHPITVNGKERSTIDLDFEALTVDAFTRADSRSHGGEGNVLTLMEANGTLHLNLAFEAAIAADQTLDITDLERLKGADIMKFAAAGRFLLCRVQRTQRAKPPKRRPRVRTRVQRLPARNRQDAAHLLPP